MAFASVKNAQKKASKSTSGSYGTTASVGDTVGGKKVLATVKGKVTRLEGDAKDNSDGPSRGSNQQVNDINQARYDNIQSGLDPYAGAGRKGQVITSSAIAPTPAINIPPTPAVDNAGTNLMTQFAGMANATPIDQAADKATENADDAFQNMLKGIAEPVDQEKLYKKAERDAGTREKQALVNTYQSQLNAIVAKAEADKLALVGQGRGVEERVIGGQQAQIDREAAIQSLPIAAQLSAANADLSAAKEYMNTLFTMRVQDATNKAAHQNKILELVYGYATDKQKTALEEKRIQDQRNFTLTTNTLNYAQTLASKALDNGQATIAASIMRLDPNDPNYASNLASYAKNIQIAPTGSGTIGTLNGKPQTATQAQVQGYADRTNQADVIIDNIGSKFAGIVSYVGQLAPNFLKSSERQQYEQAQRNFVNAVLRRESGAVISDEEFANARSQYFPQPGDQPEVIVQKQNNRETVVSNLYNQANVQRSVIPGTIIEDSSGTKYRVDIDGETLIPL